MAKQIIDDRRQPMLIDRICQLFTDIRPGEGKNGVLMALNIMLILITYYMVKPMREGWISMEELEGFSKVEIKAYSSFAQSLMLLWVVAIYGKMVSAFPRGDLIRKTTIFCLSNIFIFWLLQPNFIFGTIPGLGFLFYLWVGLFGVFMVAQTWTFIIDLYKDDAGKRLIPMIAIGATSGAVVGSWLVKQLMAIPSMGANSLLLISTLPLTASWLLCRMVDLDQSRKSPTVEVATPDNKKSDASSNSSAMTILPTEKVFDLFRNNNLLLLIAGASLLLNWVNTNGENLLYQVINEVFQKDSAVQGIVDSTQQAEFIKNQIVAFYGQFFLWVNIIALFLQAFIASRLLKYGGFAAIILLLPVLVLFSNILIVLFPVLWAIKIMKIMENATDYSINNTARHVIWLPLGAEIKFKAKPTVDSLLARFGDGLAALTILIGVNYLSMSVQNYFALNILLVAIWLWLTILIVKKHRLLTFL